MSTPASKPSDVLRLRIVQINDVYVLDRFANVSSLVKECKSSADETLVLMGGDFLGPSILSSLDRGRGMVDVMGASGVTHTCFGNHECDIPTDALPKRIRESHFKWVNSNMRDLDTKLNVKTPSHDIITVTSSDGKLSKKLAVLGFITEDKSLYRKGAFGDADIEPVFECTKRLLAELKKPGNGIDTFIPITHQDMPIDRDYAKEFGDSFPVIIGGHDHEVYHETIDGCQIVKTGKDALNAAIIDLDWPLPSPKKPDVSPPKVTVTLVPTSEYKPDPTIVSRVKAHERILQELERAKLFKIDAWRKEKGGADSSTSSSFSTFGNRLKPSNGSTILASIIRMGMRSDCAFVNAGCIRGGKDYTEEEWFTWSDLKKEMPFSTEVSSFMIPGKVINDSIVYSRRGASKNPPEENGAYFQTCDMIHFDTNENCIKSIKGEPFDPNKLYLTTLPIILLMGLDNIVPLINWAKEEKLIINEDAGRPAKIVIVEYFSALLWLELGSFAEIDEDNDGKLTRAELKAQAEKMFGYDFADLAVENVLAVADLDQDGSVCPHEMLVTRYVATDMMSTVVTKDQTRVMTQLACEMLNLPATSEQVLNMVKDMKEELDHSKDGKVQRGEMIEALGKLKAKSLLK